MKKFLITALAILALESPAFATRISMGGAGGITSISSTTTGASTYFILNQNTLQPNSTFYVTSGTVRGQLSVINDATLPGVVITETTGQTGKMTEWKDDTNTTRLAIDESQYITDPSSNGLITLKSRPNMGSFGGNFTTELKRDGSNNSGNGTFLKFTDNSTSAYIKWIANGFTQGVLDLEFWAGYSAQKVMALPSSGGIFVYNPVQNTQDMSCMKVPAQDIYLGAGTPSPQGGFVFDPVTLRATSAISVRDAAMLLINGAPLQGTNMTLTNRYGGLMLSGDAGGIALGIRSASGQTANVTQWEVNNATPVYISSVGAVGISTTVYLAGSPGTSGQFLKSNGPGAAVSWGTASGGGGASLLAIANNGVQITSPTVGIDFGYGFTVGAIGSTATVSLVNTATGYIQNTETLQSGATFYVSSGTVNTQLNLPFTTSGSVLFSTTSGKLYQDNSGLYFNSDYDYLGIGTNAPESGLHIFSTSNQPVLGLIIADNNLTLSNPFILYDIRNGPTPSTTATMLYRTYSAGSGASTNYGGFTWGSSTSDEDFKMDTNNSRFHIIGTSGTASLNVGGNAIIGKNQIAATAPTDGLIVGGLSIFTSSMTLSGGVTVQITAPISGQFLGYDGTYWKPTSVTSGGGSLAVTTGTVDGFTGTISSPTAIINFASPFFLGQLVAGGTTFITIDTTSATGILTISSANTSFLTQSSATATYLQLSSATATYINKASSTIVYTDNPQLISGVKTFSSSVTINNVVQASSITIGTSSTQGIRLFISEGTTGYPSIASTTIQGVGSNGYPFRGIFDTYNSNTSFGTMLAGRRARGTNTSPTAVNTDDVLMDISAYGFGTSTFSATSRARAVMFASENWTDANQGTYFDIKTTSNTSTNTQTRVRVNHNGTFQVMGSSFSINGATTSWPSANASGLLRNDGLGNLSYVSLSSGVVNVSTYAAVISTRFTTAEVSVATITITPTNAQAKIAVFATASFTKDAGATARVITMVLRRGVDTTGIIVGTVTTTVSAAVASSSYTMTNFGIDAPGTISLTTYTVRVFLGAGISTCTNVKFMAFEIGGSGSPGDNLGNHIATTTLNMASFGITNLATTTWVSGSTSTFNSGASLDMTSARLTIPNGAVPNADGIGQIGFDTTDGDLLIHDGTADRVYATALTPFHVTISSWTDGWSNHTVNVFQAPLDKGITIATITACTSVAASSVTFQLEERGRNTPNVAGTDVFTIAQATANDTCAEYFGSAFTNPTMAAGTHIIFDTDSSASSGTTPDEVSITVWYWKDVE